MAIPPGIHALLSGPAGAPGARVDPYLGYNFLVEIEGLLAGGFREVRGLESHVEVKDHAEGGVNGFLHQLPGPTRYPRLVLSRGITDVDTLWAWYEEVTRGVIRRRNLTLMLLDGQRLPVMWWDIRKALPVRWVGPTFNAAAEAEIATESIELVHQGIVKPPASRFLSASRARRQGSR